MMDALRTQLLELLRSGQAPAHWFFNHPRIAASSAGAKISPLCEQAMSSSVAQEAHGRRRILQLSEAVQPARSRRQTTSRRSGAAVIPSASWLVLVISVEEHAGWARQSYGAEERMRL